MLKKLKSNDSEAKIEYELLLKLQECLNVGKLINSLDLDENEKTLVKSFNLLTSKPLIYVANLAELEINNPNNNHIIKY